MLSSDSRKEGIVIPFNIPLREAENKIIIETLKKNNYNKKKTAEILKISVRTIEMRFKELVVSLKQLKG
jgi:DNA-binding NtrC family response regulator